MRLGVRYYNSSWERRQKREEPSSVFEEPSSVFDPTPRDPPISSTQQPTFCYYFAFTWHPSGSTCGFGGNPAQGGHQEALHLAGPFGILSAAGPVR